MTELFMEFVGQPFEGSTNYNTAPRQQAWIIRKDDADERHPVEAQWWLIPNWVKEESYKYSMFNARSEKAAKSPAFRGPFRSQRCVVPITGFYEWVNRNGQKQPYFVHAPENNGLLLAGLWDRWYNPNTNEPLDSFTILTTDVVPDLKFLHHRQPVMLSKNDAQTWLEKSTSGKDLQDLCRSSLPYDMYASPVSPYVNNVRNHGEECVEIIGDTVELRASAN
ncbi:MAG: SOS response-associated peptidase [Pseudomonadales bacterium]|nr:SOS response-associated peptidase [Pseudomonadales bacterium]